LVNPSIQNMPIVTINQDTDTPARREITPIAALTYLYDRSRDSKKNNAPGQDFIAFRCTDSRLVFAVCDGVSQSFYGDLAARFVGERLVRWLSEQTTFDDTFPRHIDAVMRTWTDEATQLVQSKPLSINLAPMVRDALERKRENGSEAMFVAGVLDPQQLVVCWMGDMRLWLWNDANEPIDLPGAAWLTKERWSTRLGPKNGVPRTAVVPLDGVARITIHSDGVGSRAPELSTISLEGMDQLAEELSAAPTSDDVSILDISPSVAQAPVLAAPTPQMPDPREPVIQWEQVPNAGWYRLALTAGGSGRQWTVDTANTTFFLAPSFAGLLRVQALANDTIPSEWSEPISVGVVEAVPAEAVAEEDVAAPLPPVITARRPFRLNIVMMGALLLAAVLTVGWYALFFR
jgi:hypothetical protein